MYGAPSAGAQASARRLLVALTSTAREPLVAWEALASWAEAHGDVSLWSRALQETVRIAPGGAGPWRLRRRSSPVTARWPKRARWRARAWMPTTGRSTQAGTHWPHVWRWMTRLRAGISPRSDAVPRARGFHSTKRPGAPFWPETRPWRARSRRSRPRATRPRAARVWCSQPRMESASFRWRSMRAPATRLSRRRR